ncbi:two-component system sensor histidine kinase CreC [Ideonella sp. BN130291]|uniref:two-component system sensor histidine kinase CreC n=1 Tax=Ideonella sp. BN130291 TaxID=3112940 RepID=UPI002E276E4C|nr:two-component system sensor histidine kinase CreC [Ideonella sp. BN130291]
MKLGLRLLLAFFLITGIAAFFVLRVFVQEVRPSVREVMEDLLVDTANILAEMAADDLARMPPGGTLQQSAFAQNLRQYAARPVDAKIWGLAKQTLDYRVYVTDDTGRVVFDSGDPQGGSAVGQDYSRWRDVRLTLRGEYGARATREQPADDSSSVMHVAAPIKSPHGRIIGVLTVAKPLRTVQPFVERAERKILLSGVWLLGLSLVVGVAVTGWLVWSVRRLRHFALEVQVGERRTPPHLSGELGELASAMGAMRDRLEDRQHLEQTVRALTHELKSPMTAIAAAAELLQDELPEADRQAFARDIQEQVRRQRVLVERMLELSKLEQRRALAHPQRLALVAVADAVVTRAETRARQRGVLLQWLRREADAHVQGDAELLELAIANLLDNAIDFSPAGGAVVLSVWADAEGAHLRVQDNGPGVEDYALRRLGERFFSTPRPSAPSEPPRKGSGLGLAIVREVMALHGGRIRFANVQPGLAAQIVLRVA